MKKCRKQKILAGLVAVIKELEARIKRLPDCGGLQAVAVLVHDRKFDAKFQRLCKEAEAAGITKKELERAFHD